jgi:hypothetical protein
VAVNSRVPADRIELAVVGATLLTKKVSLRDKINVVPVRYDGLSWNTLQGNTRSP